MADVERMIDNMVSVLNAQNEAEVRRKAMPFLLRDVVQEATVERDKNVLDLAKRRKQLQESKGESKQVGDPELVPLQNIDVNKPETAAAASAMTSPNALQEMISGGPQPAAGTQGTRSPFGGPLVSTTTQQITEPAGRNLWNLLAKASGRPSLLGFAADPRDTRTVVETRQEPNVMAARDQMGIALEISQTSDMPFGEALSAVQMVHSGQVAEGEAMLNKYPSTKEKLLDADLRLKEEATRTELAQQTNLYANARLNDAQRLKIDQEINGAKPSDLYDYVLGARPTGAEPASLATTLRQVIGEDGLPTSEKSAAARMAIEDLAHHSGLILAFGVEAPPEGAMQEIFGGKKKASAFHIDDIIQRVRSGTPEDEQWLLSTGLFEQAEGGIRPAGPDSPNARQGLMVERALRLVNMSEAAGVELNTNRGGAEIVAPPEPTIEEAAPPEPPAAPAPMEPLSLSTPREAMDLILDAARKKYDERLMTVRGFGRPPSTVAGQ